MRPIRLPLAAATLSTLLAAPSSIPAQDLGKFLERAARDTVRQALDPDRLSRSILPPDRSAASRAPSSPAANPQPGASPYSWPPLPSGGTFFPEPRAGRTSRQVETHSVKTHDGWTLVAERFKPAGTPLAAPPVILCHGLTYNARFWDLDPSCSFAEDLSDRGFDVWVVNLRGCGSSQKWVWSLENAPEALIGGALRRSTRGKLGSTSHTSLDPRYANWTMDDHINFDVPALVFLVRRRTGAPEVSWVGHSMGGIVALAHLSRYKNPGINRLMAIGSQFTMADGQIPAQFLRELIDLRSRQVTGMALGPELVAQSVTSVNNLFFNVRNVLPEVYEALTVDAVEIPSIGLMQQYLTLSERGVLLDARKQFNYASGLANVRVPIFLGCGANDRFAPPPMQRFLHDRIGSTDKTLVIFGRAQGHGVDAGHDDVLVGLESKARVYPVLAEWLAAARY